MTLNTKTLLQHNDDAKLRRLNDAKLKNRTIYNVYNKV